MVSRQCIIHAPFYLCMLIILCLASGAKPSDPDSLIISPVFDIARRADLAAYRKRALQPAAHNCGIIWTLATTTGLSSDLDYLQAYANGVGLHRLLAVTYEVLSSASRVRHAVQLNTTLPTFCSGLELTLFTDRSLLQSAEANATGLHSNVECIFDRIIYYDTLPLHLLPLAVSGNVSDATRRLSARTNLLKLVAFLSTPYAYTVYLDGDTAPCHRFPYDAFRQLQHHDVFTTMNPFGFQSTNGNTTYPGAPNLPAYNDFPEPNGGVIGFKWNERTERLLVRTLELVPFFNELGFDQDQAFLRHAIFEEMHTNGLMVNEQPMRRYCRFGWNCDYNSCRTGCVVIHQRICLINGINTNYTIAAPQRAKCGRVPRNVAVHAVQYSRKYHKAQLLNNPKKSSTTATKGNKKKKGKG